MLTTAVSELVQEFCHAKEIDNVVNVVNASADQRQQTKKTIVSNEMNFRWTQY